MGQEYTDRASFGCVCRTYNMVKNRYLSNLRGSVLPARQQALDAYTIGKATAKHHRTVVDYIDKLRAMQDWVLTSADIVSLNLIILRTLTDMRLPASFILSTPTPAPTLLPHWHIHLVPPPPP